MSFIAMGSKKSQLAIQHLNLADAGGAAEARKFWTERLAALAETLG
jgi:hypothetical protein